jgi:hypothetical protein
MAITVTERRADAITLDALAHHEAGHAVAFLAFGARFEYATTCLEGGGGVVAVESWGPISHPVRAVVSHAGPLAEAQRQLLRHRTPGPPPGDRDYWEHASYGTHGWRDLEVVGDALRRLGLAADPFQAEARELLRRHWPAVERVAAALTEHRELSYADVADLAGDLR